MAPETYYTIRRIQSPCGSGSVVLFDLTYRRGWRPELSEGQWCDFLVEQKEVEKLLLVEDSKFVRLATGRALARAGYEMSFASDGDGALLIAGEKLPDLIPLDMMQPKNVWAGSSEGVEDRTCNRRRSRRRTHWTVANKCQALPRRRTFAFLTKPDLALDQSVKALLAALREIEKIPNAQRVQAVYCPHSGGTT